MKPEKACERHERRCWDCGHVAMHASDVAPWVNCDACGSQDTRRTKPRTSRIVAAVWIDRPDEDTHARCPWWWCEDCGPESPPQLLRCYRPLKAMTHGNLTVDYQSPKEWSRWTVSGWVPLVGRVCPIGERPI